MNEFCVRKYSASNQIIWQQLCNNVISLTERSDLKQHKRREMKFWDDMEFSS